jgi:hypothetical protein
MPVFTIVVEHLSTGEKVPSLLTRQPDEQAARRYAEDVIAQQADAADLRIAEIRSR